jgi:protein gp37
MADNTKIAWTDHTFNPWMGCQKVSPGCQNCYAEALVSGRMGFDVWGPGKDRKKTKTWNNPLKWNKTAAFCGKSYRVFCGSLMDVFEDHPTPNKLRSELWSLIRDTEHLTWQLLTKRPERIVECLPDDWNEGYHNVWMGCTIESNEQAGRADDLRMVPAAVRFLSMEPLLGPVNDVDLNRIHWCITGGESGPGHREMNLDWCREIRDRCKAYGVAFFHKQGNGHRPGTEPLLDGRHYREFPNA